MLERTLEKYIHAQAECLGIICIKQQGTKGVPDRLLIRKGKVVFVELKTWKGQLSPAQEAMIARLKKQGIDTLICRDRGDIDHALAQLR